MPTVKDLNIVKIAVEMDDQIPQLIEFDQKRPLTAIILDLCTAWGLTEPDEFALRFSDGAQYFITEKNRNEIKNGIVLRLSPSSTKTATDILKKLNSGSQNEKKIALRNLSKLSADYTFALEFINKQGSNFLISMIEDENLTGELMALTLQSFIELMEHGIISWDNLTDKFINKIAGIVCNHASQDVKSLHSSLSILESLVLNSSEKFELLEQEVEVAYLISHLQSPNVEVQQNALALINAFLMKADTSKRLNLAVKLISKQLRSVIMNSIIKKHTIGAEMAHQLYMIQTHLFNMLDEKASTTLNPQDQKNCEKILELRKIAFEAESDVNSAGHKSAGYSKDYKKLGFKNTTNPAEDFSEIPPGILALDNMIYFAHNYADSYIRIVLENSSRADEHECPFAQTSIELTKIICEILKISQRPTEQGTTFYPMFFMHDSAFEEFFCICIVLLNKTWKEMRASVKDFSKVMSVVKEQITRTLNSDPNLTTLDKFKQKLFSLTYKEITNLWQKERSVREEWKSHAKPIKELRELLTPEIRKLIQKQRLQYLCEGTMFIKYSPKGQRIKDKFLYCRLSPNQKVFHYGDCDEKRGIPTIEELPHKLPVLEIKNVTTGKECPHLKDIKRTKATPSLAFSLIPDSEQDPLNFVALNEKDFDYWTDGINALLGNEMTSKEAKNDFEALLSLDIRLKLLDTEGFDIPEHAPEIPKDPPNYDFCVR